jgi:uncharacterized damage-inducible protein DinB
MQLNKPLLGELQHEAASTKKILEKVPEDRLSWRPHEKSMTLGRLSGHISELFGWISSIITSDELDFAKRSYKPFIPESSEQLLQHFQTTLDTARKDLEAASDEDLLKHWKLRAGEHLIFDLPRIAALRSSAMNHIIHHRGQLSVYLRILDVSVPGMYGPSADDR